MSDRVVMARAVGRVTARSVVGLVHRGRAALPARGAEPTSPVARTRRAADGSLVALLPGPTGRARRGNAAAPYDLDVTVVTIGGSRAGELWTRADPGTSTFEIVVRLDEPGDAVVVPALGLMIDGIRATSPELRVAVRRPLPGAAQPTGPDPKQLSELGLTLVATFPGVADSPGAWPGEERWELPG